MLSDIRFIANSSNLFSPKSEPLANAKLHLNNNKQLLVNLNYLKVLKDSRLKNMQQAMSDDLGDHLIARHEREYYNTKCKYEEAFTTLQQTLIKQGSEI